MSLFSPLPERDISQMSDADLSAYESEKLDVEQNMTVGAVSYIYLLSLVVLYARRDSKFAQYHARQGTALFCLALIFLALPSWFGIIAEVLVFLAMVYGFIQASQGRWVRFPGITAALENPHGAGVLRGADRAFLGLTGALKKMTRPGERTPPASTTQPSPTQSEKPAQPSQTDQSPPIPPGM